MSSKSSRTFTYVLSDHRDLPESERSTFHFRFLKAREADHVETHFNESRTAASRAELTRHILDGLRLAIVGWDNVKDASGNPVAFNADELAAVLTPADFLELRDEILDAMLIQQVTAKREAFAAIDAAKYTANSATAATTGTATATASA